MKNSLTKELLKLLKTDYPRTGWSIIKIASAILNINSEEFFIPTKRSPETAESVIPQDIHRLLQF